MPLGQTPETDPVVLLARARETLHQLATLPDRAAFDALLALSSEIGVHLGTSARILAEAGSWAQVASAAGTTRQAAWARWHQPGT